MNITGEPLYCANAADWRAWLQANHAAQSQAWLLISKKNAATPSVTLEEAIDEALCFGWIDSVMKSLDAEKYALRFTPRKKTSRWSEGNKKKVAQLIEQGRMTAAGLAKIEEAKRNGRWEPAA